MEEPSDKKFPKRVFIYALVIVCGFALYKIGIKNLKTRIRNSYAQNELVQARVHLKDKEYKAALSKLEEIIKNYPNTKSATEANGLLKFIPEIYELDYENPDNLIALWLVYKNREVPVHVTRPYATFMVWSEGEKSFRLYDNIKKEVIHTDDFDEFIESIEKLPPNQRIQLFDTCQTSMYSGMPQKERDRLEKAVTSNGKDWSVNELNGRKVHIICTCETKSLRFP